MKKNFITDCIKAVLIILGCFASICLLWSEDEASECWRIPLGILISVSTFIMGRKFAEEGTWRDFDDNPYNQEHQEE